MNLRPRLFASALCSVLALTCGIAQAATVSVNDNDPGGSVTISWTGFDLGFSVKYFDTPETTATFSPDMSFGSISVVSFGPISFNGAFTATGGADGSVTLHFTDPGTSHVRDILQVSSERAGETGTLKGSLTTSFTGDLGD